MPPFSAEAGQIDYVLGYANPSHYLRDSDRGNVMGYASVAAIIGSILLPPPALDHKPNGAVGVYEYPLAEIEAQCRKLGPMEPNTLACALRFSAGECVEILPHVGPGGVSIRDRALLRRHEDGHCNQERPDHVGWSVR